MYIIIFMLFLIGLVYIIAWKMFNIIVSAKTSKKLIFTKCEDEDFDRDINMPIQRIQIKAFDGLMLNAYICRDINIKRPWVVCVHGYNGVPSTMYDYAEHFKTLNFNVLVPELRGHGESKGKYIGLSYLDGYDINSWVNWILNEHIHAEIILFGVSMGGASIVMCCEYNQIDNVKAIITDSAPSDMYRQIKKVYRYITKLPVFPILYATDIITRLRAGFSLKNATVVKNIKNQRKPWLIIHGEKDGFVDGEMAKELYEKAECPKKIVLFECADHVQALKSDSVRYWGVIDKFIFSYLDI